MADNKKVLIEVQVKTAGAANKLNGLANATEKVGGKAKKTKGAFTGLSKSMLSIAKGFIIIKSFQTLGRLLISVAKVSAKFELAMAKVKAISGATAKELNDLEESAKALALGTTYTATQVAELQLVYSKFGFSVEEIKNVQEATLDLATATGEDLAKSADVVASTLRGFNLDATETARVVDVMGMAFSSSALNLENFRQAMKTVAPVASAANVDLETTTAMLGVLSDRGLRGTVAATGLKNIMMALGDESSGLAKHLGYVATDGEGMMKAFKDLGEEGIDLAVSMGLITKRAVPAFLALANSASSIRLLKNELDNATGSIEQMANTVEDTLSGSFKIIQSEWENVLLELGDDLEGFFKNTLKVTSAFLKFWNKDFSGMGDDLYDVFAVWDDSDEIVENFVDTAKEIVGEGNKLAIDMLETQEKRHAKEKESAKKNGEDLLALEKKQSGERSKLIGELAEKSLKDSEKLRKSIDAKVASIDAEIQPDIDESFLELREDYNERVELMRKKDAEGLTYWEEKKLNYINENFALYEKEEARLLKLKEKSGGKLDSLDEQKLQSVKTRIGKESDARESHMAYIVLEESYIKKSIQTKENLIQINEGLVKNSETLKGLNDINLEESIRVIDSLSEEQKKQRDEDIKAEIELRHLKAKMYEGTTEEKKAELIKAHEFEKEKTKELSSYIESTSKQKLVTITSIELQIFNLKKQLAEKEKDLNKQMRLENKITLNAAKQESDELTRLLKIGNAYNLMKGNVYDNFKGTDLERDALMSSFDVMISENEKDVEDFLEWLKEQGKEIDPKEMVDKQLRALSEVFDKSTELYTTLIDNKLNKVKNANETEMRLFKNHLKEQSDLYDVNQKHALTTFRGSMTDRADFERQQGLEKIEFQKKQQQKEDDLKKKQIDRENELGKKAFNAEKANSVAQIAISTTQAVMKVWGETGLAGLALQALPIAAGALNIASVVSQQYNPKTYQDGGMLKGQRHYEGGIPFSVGGSLGFEAEGGEYIMSRNTVNRIGEANLDAMNFGNMTPSINGGDIGRADLSRGFENKSMMAQQIAETIASSVISIPVINKATDTTSVARRVENAVNMAKF